MKRSLAGRRPMKCVLLAGPATINYTESLTFKSKLKSKLRDGGGLLKLKKAISDTDVEAHHGGKWYWAKIVKPPEKHKYWAKAVARSK